MLVGLVGMDVTSGQPRFTFGQTFLADGINIGVIAMGLFGVAELIGNAGRPKPVLMRASDITSSDPDAKGEFFESPQGKEYRHATYYTESEQVPHL